MRTFEFTKALFLTEYDFERLVEEVLRSFIIEYGIAKNLGSLNMEELARILEREIDRMREDEELEDELEKYLEDLRYLLIDTYGEYVHSEGVDMMIVRDLHDYEEIYSGKQFAEYVFRVLHL
jgi:succinylglutamate desuccinylase